MAADGFGLQGIRKSVEAALAALRAREPVVFHEYRPVPPEELRLAAGEPPPVAPEIHMRGAGWIAFGVSVAVHVPILAYVLTQQVFAPEPRLAGLSPTATAPISVELVDSRVFQAMIEGKAAEAAPAPSAAPAAAEPSTTAALPEDTPTASAAQPQSPAAAPAAPEILAAATPPAVSATEAGPPLIAVPTTESGETPPPASPDAKITATPVQSETQPTPQKPGIAARTHRKAAARDKAEHRKHQRQASLGSQASAGESSAETRAAQKSASRGAGLSYRNQVMSHLAGHRPSSSAVAGTVKVAFTLSPSGHVASAHISLSSGKPDLDRRALSAVRGASPFPTPPAGLSASQRSFNMPFFFR